MKGGILELISIKSIDKVNPLFLIGLFSVIVFLIGVVLNGILLIACAGFLILIYLMIFAVWVRNGL